MPNFLKILIIGFLVANLIKPAFALYHQDYLNKIFSQNLYQSKSLNEIDYSKAVEDWLNQSETIINQRINERINSKLILEIDSKGYIQSINLLDSQENDIDKFKRFIAAISNIQFQPLPTELNMENQSLKLILDTSILYFERPSINYLTEVDDFKIQNSSKIDFSKNLLDKLSKSDSLETELVDPQTIIYPNIGDKITLKVMDKIFTDEFREIKLTANIINSSNDQFIIEVYSIENNNLRLPTKIQYELNHNRNKKNFTAELINSSLNSAIQGGIINAINSYGIVPASLAILSASGKAMQLEETSNAINLSKGDLVIINKREMKK